jgi:ferredoxin
LRASSNDDQGGDHEATAKASHDVKVTFGNESLSISVHEDETILAALERHAISDRMALPSTLVPSDCRRGNCLTCTGSHASSASRHSHSVVTDDGLSPHMSSWMQEKGFILTCSSKVVGDGLELRLGASSDAWEEAYRKRLEDEHAKRIGWAAMARTKRKSDEKNVPKWKKETEGVLFDKGENPGN